MNDPGILFDEPMAEYHSSDAFGSHDLEDLRPHPILFYRKHVSKTLKDASDSPALAFGRYFHALALEGEETAAAGFVQAPEGIDRRTKDGKAQWAAFEAECAGREIITKDDNVLAWRMVQAIREKPSLCRLLDPAKGHPEVTFRVQMKRFQLQARVDWYVPNPEGGSGPMDVNVKTVNRLADFDDQFYRFAYYRNSAFYRAVMAKALNLEVREPQMVYLVVEKQEPFQAVIRVPDAQSLEIGWSEVAKDIGTINTCFESGQWPGEPDEPRALSLPEWKVKRSIL